MSYDIKETLLPLYTNRPGTKINPTMLVIHETATPNASDESEYQYFCGGNRNASAHYFVDYDSISRFIPEDEKAWHAGAHANAIAISIELCHFDDPAHFQEVWNRGVWLAADICKRWNIDPGSNVVSHAWVSNTWHESNHQDPLDYFQAHGKTVQDFINDMVAVMNGSSDYRVHVGTVYESYATKKEATLRVWTLFNSGYKDVSLTGPDISGEYKPVDHPSENALAYKIWFGKNMYESYLDLNEAHARGWYLLHFGYPDVYLEDANGYTFTFKDHPDIDPTVFKVFVGTVIETYVDEKEAYARGWALFNDASGQYKGVYLVDKALNKYVFADNVKDNPAAQKKDTLWRLKIADKQVGAFSVLANAKTEGWRLFNTGNTDVILYSPDGYAYTFHEHPDENPKNQVVTPPTPTPAPTPTPSVQKYAIVGTAEVVASQMGDFVLANNASPKLTTGTIYDLAQYYLDNGTKEGIRGDIAFAQAIKETGFFNYGGDVLPEQNNYCGLGTTGGGVKGAYFSTPEEGARAQIQHLKAYATTDTLITVKVDPRYDLVTKGIATNWEDLNGKWAVPGNGYGEDIIAIFEKIKAMPIKQDPQPTPAPVVTPEQPVPTPAPVPVEPTPAPVVNPTPQPEPVPVPQPAPTPTPTPDNTNPTPVDNSSVIAKIIDLLMQAIKYLGQLLSNKKN